MNPYSILEDKSLSFDALMTFPSKLNFGESVRIVFWFPRSGECEIPIRRLRELKEVFEEAFGERFSGINPSGDRKDTSALLVLRPAETKEEYLEKLLLIHDTVETILGVETGIFGLDKKEDIDRLLVQTGLAATETSHMYLLN